MQIWSVWVDLLEALLGFLATGLGLGWGLGIVAMTLLLRAAMLPVSWSGAYRGCLHRKRLAKLTPELDRIRERYKDRPRRAAEETMALYRRRDISPFEGRALLVALAQTPIFLGMFHALRDGAAAGRFLWIGNLAKPDTILAVFAGLTTALVMLANPDLPEQMRAVLILVPCVIAVVAALKFSSALAVFWAVSNCVTAAQTAAVHFVVDQRIRNGALSV